MTPPPLDTPSVPAAQEEDAAESKSMRSKYEGF